MSQGACIAYSAFWPQDQSDRPRSNLDHNSTHKFLRINYIDRPEILRNIKPALFLIVGQHSGDPSSEDLGHP